MLTLQSKARLKIFTLGNILLVNQGYEKAVSSFDKTIKENTNY